MKKIVLTTAMLLLACSHAMSQCKENETISTNPANPVNTELPSGHRSRE